MSFKKIIIVTSGRINYADTTNNGLLFRNLFRSWPKDNIAQVFNSGDNGDKGFFYSYFKLGINDRRFGNLYGKLHKESLLSDTSNNQQVSEKKYFDFVFLYLKSLLIDTGVYELFFRPKLSFEFKKWIDDFKPDLILVQGYSITFTELPLLMKEFSNAKLVFFTTDDWPTYLYKQNNIGLHRFLSFLPRLKVSKTVKKMIKEVDIPIAFGYPMQEEYTKRYKKKFHSIIHSDDFSRFEMFKSIRIQDKNTLSIVTIGTFNKYRWPLLKDFDLSCQELNSIGISAKLTVVSDFVDDEGIDLIKKLDYVDLQPDPGSDEIIKLLKGADILLLIEGFDENFANSIKLSISTKAHLYMFSKVPILLYSHPKTGIVNYATKFGWAVIVVERDISNLTVVIKNVYLNKKLRNKLIQKAHDVAIENHDVNMIEEKLYQILHFDNQAEK